jgi:uncharacterized protein
MRNAINWFDIPVKDLNRAKKFYESILDIFIEVQPSVRGDYKMGMLPYDMNNEGVGGMLVEGKDCEPSRQGVFIYLNGGEDLNIPLAKVEKAGGKVLMPKTSIGPNGFMAQFEDTEGNRLGLHSWK